jgi:hypothetical protein
MRAIVLEKFGGPDGLVIEEIPEPEPRAGYVTIQASAAPSALVSESYPLLFRVSIQTAPQRHPKQESQGET